MLSQASERRDSHSSCRCEKDQIEDHFVFRCERCRMRLQFTLCATFALGFGSFTKGPLSESLDDFGLVRSGRRSSARDGNSGRSVVVVAAAKTIPRAAWSEFELGPDFGAESNAGEARGPLCSCACTSQVLGEIQNHADAVVLE